jgi:heptosyltransferase-2
VVAIFGSTSPEFTAPGLPEDSRHRFLVYDTGPMHLAAAVGTPVVAIFGSTSPEFTAPGLPEDSRHRFLVSDAPCSPCFHRECPIDFRCMHGIDVDRVVRALAEVVAC